MSLKAAVIGCLAICAVLLLCAYHLRDYPSTEYDEGVYLTTFKSVQAGFPLYQQTYFSQLPGIFLTTFPIYALLGSTLAAARLAVFIYSLLGLLAIFWLGWEFNSPSFGFVAIGFLYLIPIYTAQILTFHGDSLPPTFSTLALAAIIHFRRSRQRRWIVLSACCAAIAVAIKADLSSLPPILLLFLIIGVIERHSLRRFIQIAVIFGAAFGIAALLSTLPFGLGAIINNVIDLRLDAASYAPFDPNVFLGFLKDQPQLIVLLALGLVLSSSVAIQRKTARLPLALLLTWVASTFVLLFSYRPLMEHHLVLLAVPIVLLFAFALVQGIDLLDGAVVLRAAVPIFVLAVLISRVSYVLDEPRGITTSIEKTGISLVRADSAAGDYIITDDGLVSAFSQRLTPPDLTDLSAVRISTGDITDKQFETILTEYKPKLVLAWDYRLMFLPDFAQIMQQFHYLPLLNGDPGHQAYVLNG
ncbi:MAG TPA: glycosyltransferase family 39 protein [Phototrophicaceae bacterium]|nr:glycosyltransferase family 39 protein [Phototrophicaceae bacterium]